MEPRGGGSERWIVAIALLLGCGGSDAVTVELDASVPDGARDGRRPFDAPAVDADPQRDARPERAPDGGGTDGAAAFDAGTDAGRAQRCEAEEDLGTAVGVGVATGTTWGGDDDVGPECGAVVGLRGRVRRSLLGWHSGGHAVLVATGGAARDADPRRRAQVFVRLAALRERCVRRRVLRIPMAGGHRLRGGST